MKDKEEIEIQSSLEKIKIQSSLLENFIKLGSKGRLYTEYRIFVGSRNSKKWFFVEDDEEEENER